MISGDAVMPVPLAPLALMSDFGQQDWFVAAMKGTILTICPNASIVDLCHQVDPGNVAQGAFTLAACFDDFPTGTVFCCVVDPGVGTARLALIAEGTYSSRRYAFVAPDNGLLTLVYRRADSWRCFEINHPAWRGPKRSETFHGRDVFAPAAANYLAGRPLEESGPAVDEIQMLTIEAPRMLGDREVIVTVLHIDRFGNLIFNLSREDARKLICGGRLDCQVEGGPKVYWAESYGAVEPGQGAMYWGSLQLLELGVNQGVAAEVFGKRVGDTMTLRLLSNETEKGRDADIH